MMSLLSAALITKLDHFQAAGPQQNLVSQQNLSPVIVSVGSVFPSKPTPAHILCLTVKVKVRLALIREFPGYINGFNSLLRFYFQCVFWSWSAGVHPAHFSR